MTYLIVETVFFPMADLDAMTGLHLLQGLHAGEASVSAAGEILSVADVGEDEVEEAILLLHTMPKSQL